MPPANRSRINLLLVNLAAFVIVVAGMKAASGIVVQILLAAFLAIITSPLFFFLQRRGVRPAIALLILVGILVLGVTVSVSVIGNSVASFTRNLPEYQARVQSHIDAAIQWLDEKEISLPWQEPDRVSSGGEGTTSSGEISPGFDSLVEALAVPIGAEGTAEFAPEVRAALGADAVLVGAAEQQLLGQGTVMGMETGPTTGWSIADFLNTDAIFSFAGKTFGAVSNMLGKGFVILLIAIFFLLEAAVLPRKVQAAVGEDVESYRRIQEAVANVRHYMGMKTLISLLTGFLVWLMAVIFRVDYAVLLGVLAFALNYIPSVGSIMAAIPGVLLALVQFGPGRAAFVALCYMAINIGIGNVLEPRVMGRGLGLSPAIILISLVFWGWVLGPIGMLLSVPLTMSIKIGLQSHEETRGIALILSSKPPPEPMG